MDGDRLRRRLAAQRLFARGWTQVAVAKELRVSRTTAMRWRRAWGQGNLTRTRRPGRPRKLQGAALARALSDIPRSWAVDRIAEELLRRTGVRYHPGHLWRVLKGWGWSVEPPRRIGRVCDPDGNEIVLLQPGLTTQ